MHSQLGREAETRPWCDLCALLHAEAATPAARVRTVNLTKVYDPEENCRKPDTDIRLVSVRDGRTVIDTIPVDPFYE